MTPIGVTDVPRPALLISTSTLPNSDLTLSNRAFTAASSTMSTAAVRIWTLGLIFRSSAASESSSTCCRATSTRPFASGFANAGAYAYSKLVSLEHHYKRDTHVASKTLACTRDHYDLSFLRKGSRGGIYGWIHVSVRSLCELGRGHKEVARKIIETSHGCVKVVGKGKVTVVD